jgi:hypothetical protein
MQIGYSPLPHEARVEAGTDIVHCTIETASFDSERTLTRMLMSFLTKGDVYGRTDPREWVRHGPDSAFEEGSDREGAIT